MFYHLEFDHNIVPMSAESDLLFPQGDSLMFSDFAHLPEFEDLSKDIFLSTGIDEITGEALLEDLDCKDSLKPLLMPELNDFSTSLEGTKAEDEEENITSAKAHESPFRGFMHGPSEESMEFLQAESKVGLPVSDALSNKSPIMASIMRAAEGGMISLRTVLATNEMNCMSLEEEMDLGPLNSEKTLHALSPFDQVATITSNGLVNALTQGDRIMTSMPSLAQGDMSIRTSSVGMSSTAALASLASLSSLKQAAVTRSSINGATQSSTGEPMSALTPLSPLRQVASTITRGMISSTTHADTMATIVAPSVFQINSPISSPSPTISSSDGGSLLNKMRGHEETINIHLMNASIAQPAVADLSSVTDCSSVSSIPSPQADVCRGTIPRHVMQEVSNYPTIQRSQSSHALGQFRTSSHLDTCPEEFTVSPVEMPIAGFSNLSPFTHYQASNLPGLAERSPTVSMRRVFSTGDLQLEKLLLSHKDAIVSQQAFNGIQICYGDKNVSRVEHSNNEETLGLKIGHYTSEERKVRLHRYRQKRNERNFSKKIKYACRKTLADSRPRIRGRFARTIDDSGELLLKENGASHDDEYDEVDGVMMVNGQYGMPNNAGPRFWNAVGMNAAMRHGV